MNVVTRKLENRNASCGRVGLTATLFTIDGVQGLIMPKVWLPFEFSEMQRIGDSAYLVYGSASPNPHFKSEWIAKAGNGTRVKVKFPKATVNAMVRQFGEMSMGVSFIALEVHLTSRHTQVDLHHSFIVELDE